MKFGRRARLAVVVAVVAAAGASASVGPLVRSRIDRAAARAGATVTIESVRPAWNGAVLRGVTVRLEDVPSATVQIDEVRIDGALVGERVVAGHGGRVALRGETSALAQELAALRGRLGSAKTDAASKGRTRLSMDGLRVSWSPSSEGPEAIVASGLRVAPGEAGSFRVESQDLTVAVGSIRGDMHGVVLELRQTEEVLRIAALGADRAQVEIATGLLGDAGGGAARGDGASPAALRTREGAAAHTPSGFRSQVALVAAVLDERFTPEAGIVVEALSGRLIANGSPVTIGPGRFELRREEGTPRRLVVQVERAADEGGGKSLALRIAAPFGEGSAAAPLVVKVQGGPIPLAALGLREGELGLVEPGHALLEADASVEVDDAAGLLRFDGDGRVRGMSLRHAALSDEPIRGIDLGFRGTVEAKLDGSSLRAPRGELEVGALRVVADGAISRRPAAKGPHDEWEVDVRWKVPMVPCQSLLDAAPQGLLPLVAGSTMAGSLSLEGAARFDTGQIDKTYDVRWDAAVGCRMVAPRPQVAIERFLKPFKKTIYMPEGGTREAEFGPGTPDWVPRQRITHVMGDAVITAEDGRFERHGGFDHEAIRNSIRENLRSRKFVRGASTISMQLAKNLYLARDKTLSRKLEEAVLTLYLEQMLTKDQLMELYLNVVEFGPMVYGIGPAAQHYFRTSPGALSVSQCFYLASILPSPNKQHFAAGGAVTGSWMNHLKRLIRHAHKRHRLSDVELDEGLTEVPVFGSSSPIRMRPEGEVEGEDGALRREPWAEGDGDG